MNEHANRSKNALCLILRSSLVESEIGRDQCGVHRTNRREDRTIHALYSRVRVKFYPAIKLLGQAF